MGGKVLTKAVVLEGDFFVNYKRNGLHEVLEEKIIRVNTGDKDPSKDLFVTFKKVSAFLCTWEDLPTKYYDLAHCSKRLIIEQLKKLEYHQREVGVMSNSDLSCTSLNNCMVNIKKANITVAYTELMYLFHVLRTQIEHFSSVFLKKVKAYYKSVVPKLREVDIHTKVFVYNEEVKLDPLELCEGLKRAILFYLYETEQVQKLIHELIRYNTTKVNKSTNQALYKSSIIFEAKTLYEYKIKQANIVLLYYLKEIYAPLLLGKVLELSLNYSIMNKSEIIHTDGSYSVDYYNELASVWEPFLEPFKVKFKYELKKDDEVIDIVINDFLNINVTDEFILLTKNYLNSLESEQAIKPCFSICDDDSSKQNLLNKFNNITTSNYAIDNQSGELLIVSSPPNKKRLFIEPNEKINIYLKNGIDTDMLIRHKEFLIKIEFDPRLNIPAINWSDLSSTGNLIHKSDAFSFTLSNELIYSQKVLTISTSYQLVNKLNIPLYITFYPADNVPKTYTLTSSLSVPIFLLNVPATISLKNKRGESEFVFNKLKETLSSQEYHQMRIERKFYVIVTALNNDLQRLCIWPPFFIQNSLPLSLSLEFIGKDKGTFIDNDKSRYIYNRPMDIKGGLEVKILNFKKLTVNCELVKIKHKLKLHNEAGQDTIVNMQILMKHKAYCTIIFYAKYTLKNLTKDHLTFYTSSKLFLTKVSFNMDIR